MLQAMDLAVLRHEFSAHCRSDVAMRGGMVQVTIMEGLPKSGSSSRGRLLVTDHQGGLDRIEKERRSSVGSWVPILILLLLFSFYFLRLFFVLLFSLFFPFLTY